MQLLCVKDETPLAKERTMGVLSRINDIVRSNLNDLVSKAENPEKMLNQAILDMENHLNKARKLVIETVAVEKQMEKRRLNLLEQASRWERRAALALSNKDEELARQALSRKNDLQDRASTLEEQIRVQREYIGALKQSLISLEERHQDAKTKKDALVTRAIFAKQKKKATDRISNKTSSKNLAESRAFNTFERMEDNILSIEAQADAISEISTFINNNTDAELNAKFIELEKKQNIEEQLSKLKQQLATEQKKKRQTN
jgi:phage shock protein A